MPVKKPAAKKTAAKKTTPAKKTAAKSAAPALAKKVAQKKTTKKASASASSDASSLGDFVKRFCAAIVGGHVDGFLVQIDEALAERMNIQAAENAKAEDKKSAEKKVSSAPKRTKSEDEGPVTLEAGKTYQVKDTVKNIGGAKVKFHRFKVDDDSKAVIEMVEDRSGYPKGKRISISAKSLVAVAAKRTAAKRSPKK